MILACGQTGAGKTYSMIGLDGIDIQDIDYHRIVPRSIQHVSPFASDPERRAESR